MAVRPRYDILLAGIGVGGRANTTVATIELLRRARITLSLSVHTDWLRRICRKVVDLRELYYTGEEDERVYRRLTNLVLEEATRGSHVALVDDGHPLIYDDVCLAILRRGRRRGLKVIVQPAVSCLDAMVAECGVVMELGFQMVEATTLVATRQRLNPSFETLVLQLGWFGTSLLEPIEGHRPERFKPLQEYLLHFFAPGHRVRVLRARRSSTEPASISTCRLDRLSHHYRRIEVDSTLHIPPTRAYARWDSNFARQTTDPGHLERIALIGK
jgi:precorrin-3B methylase